MNARQLVPVANRYRLEPQPHSSSSPSTQSCVPPFSEHHPTTGCYTNVRQEISLFTEIMGYFLCCTLVQITCCSQAAGAHFACRPLVDFICIPHLRSVKENMHVG